MGETSGGLNEETVVGKTRRVLSPESARPWIYGFVTNPVYGGFSMNVLADFFVRLVVFIGTSLAVQLCFRRANQRERILKQLELQRQLGEVLALCRLLESKSVGSPGTPGTPGTPGVLQAAGPATQSSSAPPSVPENHAQATSSTTVLPTESKKGPSDQLRQRKLNGFTNRSRSLNHTSSDSTTGSSSTMSSDPTQAPKFRTGEDFAKEHHVIDMPLIFTFPSTSTKTEKEGQFEDKFKDRFGVPIEHGVHSSRIMQARVPATDENLRALHDLAIEGMRLDEDFTLQIGASVLYYCNGNPEEPVLLSLRGVEVPTILQAEYSAGMLIIRGRYLEGAEIRAATSDGYMICESVKQVPIDNDTFPPEERIEMWRCTDLMPPVKLERIQIFASKRVLIEGHSVTVRSEVSPIQNTTLRTVIYKWMPAIIIIITMANQVWVLLEVLFNMMKNLVHRFWLIYPAIALTMYILQLLSPSLEKNTKNFIERFKLAISSFHVFPEPLASPTYFMRNGFCFQRGAKYLISLTPMFGGHDKQERVFKQERVIKQERIIKQEKKDKEEKNKDEVKKGKEENYLKQKRSSTLKGLDDINSEDWKWPCWRTLGTYKKLERFDFDDEPISNDESPFEVIYGQGIDSNEDMYRFEKDWKYPFILHQSLPKDILVKLHSKHLQNVVRKCLPKKVKQFENHREIKAKDLLISYINGNLKENDNDLWSNFPPTSNDLIKRNDLHMFHLIRFLKKEYDDVIKQYNRMMEASVFSWDMLWTLIVPNIDVIYYCMISKQEMCGKVSTANYNLKKPYSECHFEVELEVYDFDCNDFKAMKIEQKIYVFHEEVKIINLDMFPLKYKANPCESEEYFFRRGRIFCDLVLKYKRQYMHYCGVMYDPFNTRLYDGRKAREKRHNFKASVDGRVMIDQKWFAKLNPKWDMGTARAGGWLRINDCLEMRISAIANEFDSLLKYSPAIVYGYSFSIRKWGCFYIEGFSKIHYISSAFDKLVMKDEYKLMLLTLTEYYIKHPNGPNNVATQIDLLPNKGQGCVIVLHGPPGTGKTLTVESLAEKLECPLWQLSISRLITSTKELENKMIKTFEVAKSWGAILVLDEADVYLSSRKYSPLSSNNTWNNAMTGVFLRVLEHYKGVLFLTTNVMNHIEPAIFSRISLFIKYEEFSREERKKLWSNFLNESNISNLSEEFWKKVLPAQFNGRVIRNIIQNAQILIQSKKFATKTIEERLLIAFDSMTTPSTMSFLIESRDPNQAFTESAPSIPSAPTYSYFSNLPQLDARD